MDGVGTNKVVMDLDIVYHGDARVQISVMKVSAGASDLKLKGKLRVVMNLIDDLPFIGSIELMFLRPPDLDFDLEDEICILHNSVNRGKIGLIFWV